MEGMIQLIRAKFLRGTEIDMDFSDGMSVTVDLRSVFKIMDEITGCKEVIQNFKVIGDMIVWDFKKDFVSLIGMKSFKN